MNDHNALITWSSDYVAIGLPHIEETIDPAVFIGTDGFEDAWSLVCAFTSSPAAQGNPSRARVRFWVGDAPHERLRPGAVLELFERATRKSARVEIID